MNLSFVGGDATLEPQPGQSSRDDKAVQPQKETYNAFNYSQSSCIGCPNCVVIDRSRCICDF